MLMRTTVCGFSLRGSQFGKAIYKTPFHRASHIWLQCKTWVNAELAGAFLC